MPNIALNQAGDIIRLDLGKKGYTVALKSCHIKQMEKLMPNNVKLLSKEELNTLRKGAANKNEKYANSYKNLLNKLKKSEVEEHYKYIKRLDRKLAQFHNFINSDKISQLPPEPQKQAIENFYKDINNILNKSKNEDIKIIYKEELNNINKKRRYQDI